MNILESQGGEFRNKRREEISDNKVIKQTVVLLAGVWYIMLTGRWANPPLVQILKMHKGIQQ